MVIDQTIPNRIIHPLIADTTTWIRSPSSGILQMSLPLGSKVGKNYKLGEITDPFGIHGPTVSESPVSSMVIGRLNLPLVHQGDAVIHIAHTDKLSGIEPVIADFKEEVQITSL